LISRDVSGEGVGGKHQRSISVLGGIYLV